MNEGDFPHGPCALRLSPALGLLGLGGCADFSWGYGQARAFSFGGGLGAFLTWLYSTKVPQGGSGEISLGVSWKGKTPRAQSRSESNPQTRPEQAKPDEGSGPPPARGP